MAYRLICFQCHLMRHMTTLATVITAITTTTDLPSSNQPRIRLVIKNTSLATETKIETDVSATSGTTTKTKAMTEIAPDIEMRENKNKNKSQSMNESSLISHSFFFLLSLYRTIFTRTLISILRRRTLDVVDALRSLYLACYGPHLMFFYPLKLNTTCVIVVHVPIAKKYALLTILHPINSLPNSLHFKPTNRHYHRKIASSLKRIE